MINEMIDFDFVCLLDDEYCKKPHERMEWNGMNQSMCCCFYKRYNNDKRHFKCKTTNYIIMHRLEWYCILIIRLFFKYTDNTHPLLMKENRIFLNNKQNIDHTVYILHYSVHIFSSSSTSSASSLANCIFLVTQ
jgi:hypothetical protein